jgi:hypothetical protein
MEVTAMPETMMQRWAEHLGDATRALRLLHVFAAHEAGHAIAALQLYPHGYVSFVRLADPGEEELGEVAIECPYGYFLPAVGLAVLGDPAAYRSKVIRARAALAMAGIESQLSISDIFDRTASARRESERIARGGARSRTGRISGESSQAPSVCRPRICQGSKSRAERTPGNSSRTRPSTGSRRVY